MIRRTTFLAWGAALACAAPAHAAVVATLDAVRTDAVVATGVRLELEAGPRLALRIGRLEAGGLGYAFDDVRFRCPLDVQAADWSCSGPVSARRGDGRGKATLRVASAGGRVDARLAAADGVLTVGPTDDGVAVGLAKVPLDWLGPLVAALLPEPTVGGGRADATLAIAGDRLSGTWALEDASLDADAGNVGLAALDAKGRVDATLAAGARRVAIDATVGGGEWLVAPVYVAMPATPVELALELVERDGGWDVPRWSWADGATLAARGTARLAADGALHSLRVAESSARFPDAYARYLASALAPAGFGELDTAGQLRMTLDWRPGAPTSATLALTGARIADRSGRFALDGLEADVALHGAATRSSRVAWSGASLYAIPLDAATATFTLAPGDWRLDAPFAVGTLGGTLRLPHARRRVAVDGRAGWDAAIELEKLSLAALARRFGWPAFGGTLSGRIPGLHTDGDVLLMDGGLELDVFDGAIRVSELALERPFGVAPSLAADLVLEDLDLTLLTQSFSFGQIDGRLDGRIADLRLVDWAPVAFDAKLRTDPAYEGRRRISQRAVNALSAVGGGLAGGIQASVLRVFESFPYRAIGLSCRLSNNVCEMAGLDRESGSAAGTDNRGYTLVEGSGLPRLTVVGHQKRVAWPVLVARLKAATEGSTSPVVE